MIVLDYQDRRPLYEQVTEKFRTLIYQGALPADSRLPSVRQLAIELSINPNTIQRAYMTLEQEGLIYPVKGNGFDTGSISGNEYFPYSNALPTVRRYAARWNCRIMALLMLLPIVANIFVH